MIHSTRPAVFAVFGVALAAAVGCAAIKSDWSDEKIASTSPARLSAPKLGSGAVGLDVSFVSILATENPPITRPKAPSKDDAVPPDETPGRSGIEELWRWVDETAVEANVRAELRRNGLRIGRVHTESEFGRALAEIRRVPRDAAAKLLDSAAVGSDLNQASRRETCRLGKRYELPVRNSAVGQVTTLVSLGGQTIGRTLDSPQPLFAVTMQPIDTSSVRLKLQPEIQYGPMKQTWVSNDSASALRIDSRRESWILKELASEFQADKGATFVAGASFPPHGLGEQMFTGTTSDGDVDHVVMLIRIAQMPDVLTK